MILQGRPFKRHLVTDDFAKLEVHCIHSNELEKSTGTSGFMNQSSEKKPQPFSVAALLLVLVLPTVKLRVSKKQSRPNLWGWRDGMCRHPPGLSSLELDCRELLPGPHPSPRSVMPPAFPRETLYFLLPCQCFWGAATVQWPPAWQTWGHGISPCWEDQKEVQNITKCLLPAPC